MLDGGKGKAPHRSSAAGAAGGGGDGAAGKVKTRAAPQIPSTPPSASAASAAAAPASPEELYPDDFESEDEDDGAAGNDASGASSAWVAPNDDMQEALSLARAALKSRQEDYPEINLADKSGGSPADKLRLHCIDTMGETKFNELYSLMKAEHDNSVVSDYARRSTRQRTCTLAHLRRGHAVWAESRFGVGEVDHYSLETVPCLVCIYIYM